VTIAVFLELNRRIAHEKVKLLLCFVFIEDLGVKKVVIIAGCKKMLWAYLAVLVDEAATKGRHLGAVQGRYFVEDTRHHFIAAILGEEDRDGAVLEHVDERVVAGRLEGRVPAAPGVRVQAEEVGRGLWVFVVRALHIRPRIFQDFAHIGGRVADRNGAVRVVLDVVFEIALDSLQVISITSPSFKISNKLTRMYCGLTLPVA
jgi:hypothetical protein